MRLADGALARAAVGRRRARRASWRGMRLAKRGVTTCRRGLRLLPEGGGETVCQQGLRYASAFLVRDATIDSDGVWRTA
eukprot:657522-Pyramimonas_sp.AAC.1